MERKSWIAVVAAWVFVLVGCESGEGDASFPANSFDADLASVHWPDVAVVADAPILEPWRPRTHLQGTLLVDRAGELWMMGADAVRLRVSGDDTLGLIAMDDGDAIPMSEEAERCLAVSDLDWGPGNENWAPYYPPGDDDTGPYMLDGVLLERRPVSREALISWGYSWDWIESYDGGDEEWSSYTLVDEPVPLRDGTIVHTEYGFYYVARGRSYYFRPTVLAAEVGFRLEDSLSIPDRRLREIAPVAFALTRETFDRCPADDASH
jgi:hypothetical protein